MNADHNPVKIPAAGFSLVAALFIIVVLGILAAALFRMTQTSNIAVAQEVLSIRAFFAAESGAHAAAMRIFPLAGASSCSAQTINFTAAGLVGCSANVNCTSFVAEGITYYRVASEGQCGSGDLQTSRTVEVMLKDI
jgi:MSHA biogenesis protein MshP